MCRDPNPVITKCRDPDPYERWRLFRFNLVRNWNFTSQTDAIEQEKVVLCVNFSILLSLSCDRFLAWQRKWKFLNLWLRMIPHINPGQNWNFVSQTDTIEQEKVVFSSEFLNSFIPVMRSISRVTKKMKILNRWLRTIPHINPGQNWNFVSQTDAIEQVKVVFMCEFLNSFVPVTRSISRVTKKMKIFKS